MLIFLRHKTRAYARKDYLLIILVALLSGCTSPKFNKELVCEVEGGWGQTLQFITYDTYTFPDLARLGGGRSSTGGVYFDGGIYFWRSKWLMEDYAFGSSEFKQQVARQGCKQSKMSGNLLLWMPYSSPSGPSISHIVVGNESGSDFVRREIPSREGPPYLTNGDGDLLNLINWRPAGATLEQGKIVIKEETPLADVFFDKNGFMTKYFDMYLRWLAGTCDGCAPVLWRTIESADMGMTWRVTDWGVIDESKLPAEAVLPLKGGEYYYDVKLEKVLLLPPNAAISLGIKHKHLGFFGNETMVVAKNCPEKGQPVSREEGNLICSDPRSRDTDYVKREGGKEKWTAIDFSTGKIK